MAQITKPAFTVLMINLFLVIGGVQIFDAGVLQDFIQIETGDGEADIRDVSARLEQSVPSTEESFLQDPVGSTLSLFDSLGIVKDFLLLTFNVVFASIGLMIDADMPLVIKAVVVLCGEPRGFCDCDGVCLVGF